MQMSGEKKAGDIERFDKAMRKSGLDESAFAWHAPGAAPFRLAGFPWFSADRLYRRLPKNPPEPYREAVDSLADHGAGGQVHFRTDAAHAGIRVKLAGPPGMNHMAATGQCGFDCYAGEPGALRYVATDRKSVV
jgi:hypothetical protein